MLVNAKTASGFALVRARNDGRLQPRAFDPTSTVAPSAEPSPRQSEARETRHLSLDPACGAQLQSFQASV